MNYFHLNLSKLKNKKNKICIIGAGYVGLPLGIRLAEQKFNVTFIDKNAKIINSLRKGKSHLSNIDAKKIFENRRNLSFTSKYNVIKNCDFIIICLPTPLTKNKEPDLSYINDCMKEMKKYLSKGKAIFLESTTYPGTTDELAQKYLEDFIIGKNFFLIYSPEREDPANKKYNISNVPKVVSGHTKNCLRLAINFYNYIAKETVPVSSTKTAELTKLLENIYRSVNVGLVNEMKMIADKMNINIFEVIDAASTKPFGFSTFYPGPGLGGHCIPIDPFYLSWKAKEFDFSTKFIELAGEINSNMPIWISNKILENLNLLGKSIKLTKILILGLTYKKNVNDLRESPSIKILELLKKFKAKLYFNDPYFNKDFNKVKFFKMNYKKLKNFDCVVLLTDHDEYNYKKILSNSNLIFDTRGKFKKNKKIVISI